MFDTFPYDEWSEDIAAFWTFGPDGSTGTYVLTVLGIILMVVALVGWVIMEDRKLSAQQAKLLAAGLIPIGPPFAEGPPLAGPSTDPGP
jgi:hypothetical protein